MPPKPNDSRSQSANGDKSAEKQLPSIQNCPGGICAGGDITGNPTVNNFAPPSWHLTEEQTVKFKEIATALPASVRVVIQRANDTNSLRYGSEIYKLFESMDKAKPTDIFTVWDWKDGVIPQGIIVFIHDQQDVAFPVAQEIVSTLLSSHICPVSFLPKESLKEGEIRIIIGIRPQ
jgi:hypothetical protein